MSSRELDKQTLNLDNVVAAEAAVTLLTCRDAKKGMVNASAPREMPRRKVWAVGMTVVVSVTLAFAVAVVLVAVVVGLAVSKHCRHARYSDARVSGGGGRDPSYLTTVTSSNDLTSTLNPSSLTSSKAPSKPADDSPWTNIRLPDSVIPSSYALTLNVDLVNFTFSGSCSLDLSTPRARVRYVVLHSNGLRVRRASISLRSKRDRLTSRPWRVHDNRQNQYMVLRFRRALVPGETYTLTVAKYSGDIHDQLRGLYKSSYQTKDGDTRYLAATQLQAVDARMLFPCMDEPAMKATFNLTLIHHKDYVALSNMPSVGQPTSLDNSSNTVITKFMSTPHMSTYLLAIVICDFRYREKVTESGLKIRIWAREEMFKQSVHALEFAEKAYKFFEDFFGTPEIVPKADHIAIPDFSAGAMENWGLILYRETALLHDDILSSSANKYWTSLVISHEIAHTWFGNMVTMSWWDDLWLNEGFANTLMYFGLDNIYPSWKVFDLQLSSNIYPVMTKDSLLTSHAISTPIQHPDQISHTFDSISYDKGMAVLRLLRGFLGWNDFKKGLMVYVNRYKFKNAEMMQLWKTFAEVVENKFDVGAIMDTWTRQMGFPVVKVTRINSSAMLLTQSRFLLNAEDIFDENESQFKYKWIIPFSYLTFSDPVEKITWMNRGSAEIVCPENEWFLANINYMGFYRVNYDLNNWDMLIDQLYMNHQIFSSANRAGLIGDSFSLSRADQLAYSVPLRLSGYLKYESDYVPWSSFLNSVDFIGRMLATNNVYGKFQAYIYDLVAPRFHKIGTSDTGDLLDKNMRRRILHISSKVGVPDAIEWAKRAFNDWMKYGTKISPDYAIVVYSVGIQHGGEKEWDYLWAKAQESRVASESDTMRSALAQSQQPWLLWRYARWSLDPKKVRMQDVRNVFRYFSNNQLGRYVALQFMVTNWKQINKRFGMDSFLLRDIIYAATSTINNEFDYKHLKLLFEDYPPTGAAYKTALDSLALIRSNINWMARNEKPITEWLNEYTSNQTLV